MSILLWAHRSTGSLIRVVLGVSLAFLLVLLSTVWTPPATAATDSETRWGVTSANESGPDDRVSITHEVTPGETAKDYIAVRNLGTKDATFALQSGDGFFTSNGRFDMLAANQESVDSGTWISIQSEVTVPAGQTIVVPFQMVVPSTAEPGDHAAGITASITRADSQNPQLGVESRVGVRVTTRVTGEVTPNLAASAKMQYNSGWNPFRPGTVAVDVTLANSGNVRLFVTGTVSAGDSATQLRTASDQRQELLPQDTQVFPVDLENVWPMFRTTGHIQLYPSMLSADGTMVDLDPVTLVVSATAIPWAQLATLVGIALLAITSCWGYTCNRRRTAQLIALAHEQGRAEATVAATISR